MEEMDTGEEQRGFLRIAKAFQKYREYCFHIVDAKETHWKALPPEQQAMLPTYHEHFKNMRAAIETNSVFLDILYDYGVQSLWSVYWPDGTVDESNLPTPTALDMDKLLTTVRQFVRDWGADGKPERDACYAPILQQLEACFPNKEARKNVKVLIPGSGLSRLAYEVFSRGFWTQGNEFSHHMLIAGSYMLNEVSKPNEISLVPFVHNICNNRSRDDQLRVCEIPDVCPVAEFADNALMRSGSFSMCAGDFLDIFKREDEAGKWHAVLTAFFIDTAHNIIEYVETIHRMLMPGGVWVNNGPLLYHFADNPAEQSIELPWEDVATVITKTGFRIVQQYDITTTYTSNRRSMLQSVYSSKYFFAVKEQGGDTTAHAQTNVADPHKPPPPPGPPPSP